MTTTIDKPARKQPAQGSPVWWLRWVPTVVLSVLILYFLYVVISVAIVPILASTGLAYLLNPIVQQGVKRGLSRTMSSLGAILLVSVVLMGFAAYVIPELWLETTKSISKIAENFTPENAARQRELLRRYSTSLERVAGDRIEKFLSEPSSFLSGPTYPVSASAPEADTVDGASPSWIWSTLISSLDMLLVPFFVFYILVDFRGWRDSWEGLIPPRFRDPFSRLFDESGRILESYVLGQLLIGVIMAVCYAFCFWLLGVPAWAGISMVSGLLNAIPYAGTVMGIVLAGGFTVAGGGGPWELAAVLAVFVAVQTLEGYVLTPRILGGRLNLHPMAVFLGLLIGGKLFGLWGIILTIPAIAIAKVFLGFLRELYQGSYFYHAGDTPSDSEARIEERIADAADAVLAPPIAEPDEGPGVEDGQIG
jgi:predicted PurR-regulated permease PerM